MKIMNQKRNGWIACIIYGPRNTLKTNKLFIFDNLTHKVFFFSSVGYIIETILNILEFIHASVL